MSYFQHAYRLKVFSDNYDYINAHNEEFNQGKHTYTLGVNRFADWTNQEWKDSLAFKGFRGTLQVKKAKQSVTLDVDIPESVDWVEEVIFQNHILQFNRQYSKKNILSLNYLV